MYKNIFQKRTSSLSIVIMIAAIFAISIGNISCNREPEPPAPLDIPEEFNEVGRLHNEGLEFAFEQIKAQAIESVKNPNVKRLFVEGNDIREFAKKATLDFCRQNKKLKKDMDVYKLDVERFFTLNEGRKLVSEEISPALKGSLDELFSVLCIEFKKDDLPKLKAQLDAINKKAVAKLSEADATVLYCATSTGYSSYQYWMDNYKKWYFTMNFPEILEQYNNDELNKIQIKQGNIVRMGGPFSDFFDTVENWWQKGTSTFVNWWNDHGIGQIIAADVTGAALGVFLSYQIGFPPLYGAVIVGANGSICAAQTINDQW